MGVVIEKPFLKLGRMRFAKDDDVDEIERLVDFECNNVFHRPDLHELIELSVLTICQLNTAEQVTGFIALNGFPNIACLHASAWEEYIWKHFKLTDMRPHNTLFVHMFCWDPHYSRTIVKEMLKSVFLFNAYIYYIAIVMPAGGSKTIQAGYNMEMIFDRTMEFARGIKSTDLQYLYVAERSKISPRLRIRKAVEEDNDDLVPIIDRQSTRLKDLYGDFYISELIARHPESDRVLLVAEVAEVAIAVMCLNTVINYDLLNETFHLEIFWGLRKQTEAEAKSYEAQRQKETPPKVNEDISKKQKDSKPKSYVNFNEESIISDNELLTHICDCLGENGTEEYGSSYEDMWHTILIEDDALEFEIVNIDDKLLEVPNFLSYENIGSLSLKQDLGENKRLELQSDAENVSEEEEVLESQDAKDIPKFPGQANAFVIELFAIHEDFDERYGFDMLEVAFEIFPNLDYCILALPTSHIIYPLLEHFTLVSPRVCRCKCVSQALYVAHRNSVCGKINVRGGELADLKRAMQLLSRLSIPSEELTDIFTSTIKQSFVIETEGEPVGIAVVIPTKSPIFNRTRYGLTKLRKYRHHERGEGKQAGQGTLHFLVISPVLQPHANFYLREIFRLSGLSGLYWLGEPQGFDSLGKGMMSLVGEMIRVLPQRCIQYAPEFVKKSEVLKCVERNLPPFCMWYTSPRLTSLPKVDVNDSIVVVGASRTAMVFIETLIFGASSSYVNFTNITLISDSCLLEYKEDCMLGATLMFPITMIRSLVSKYSDRYVKSVPIQYFVDSITDIMVEINRLEKYVLLSNGSRKYYDLLFLMCGTQYQHPDYLKELLPAETGHDEESPRNCLHTLMDDPKRKEIFFATKFFTPENFFIINTAYDANVALQAILKRTASKSDYNVVVYGYTIQAYCCLNGLLAEGIPAARIIFVEPFPCGRKENYHISFFNNEYVDEMVNRTIEQLGIRVYRKFYLARDEESCFTYSQNELKSVKFISQDKLLELECTAFIYYGVQGVNINSFIALNKCGLVYDGGVVINEKFETNDESIYCAGSMTKYRRIYYSDMHRQKYYHYQDIGFALGEIIRKKLDPFMIPGGRNVKPHVSLVALDPKENIFKLPTFQSPITVEAKFPGGLHYLNMRQPGEELPLEVHIAQERYGRVYETNKSGYFHLHFDSKNKVCGITCLSKKPFNTKNILTLYGRHEQLLNNFMARFAANKIDDLFVYFSETWMYALYNEFFDCFLCKVQDVIPPVVEGFAETLLTAIEDTLVFTNKPGSATADSEKACTHKYKELGYSEQIIAVLIHWLSEHTESLPCFAIPEVVNFVCAEVNIALALRE